MFPDLEYIKTLTNGIKSRFDKIESKLAGALSKVSSLWSNRPNWNQNDSSALDFIKGRTHWSKTIYEKLDTSTYLTTAVTSDTWESSYGLVRYAVYSELKFPFWDSANPIYEMYRVTFDENVYICKRKKASGYDNYLGNACLVDKDKIYDSTWGSDTSGIYADVTENTGEPFCLVIHNYYSLCSYVFTTNDNAEHTIVLEGITEYVTKLSDKFLPAPTSETAGAIKADPRNSEDTQPVRLGTDGKLYSSGVPIFTTSGTGSAYTANVQGITGLVSGMLVVMIPHEQSTSTTPTLNINGLGAHQIKRFQSVSNSNFQSGYLSSWLPKYVPVLLIYSPGYWLACNLTRPYAPDLSGVVPVSCGGTGEVSLTAGSYLVGNGANTVQFKTPAQVLADIGAIPKPTTAAVGQAVVVKAVDENGKPTEWETVDLPGGGEVSGETWELLGDVTLAENASSVIFSDIGLENYKKFAYEFSANVDSGTQVFVNVNGANATAYAVGNILYANAGYRRMRGEINQNLQGYTLGWFATYSSTSDNGDLEWPDREGVYLTVREKVVSFKDAQFPISNIKIWVNAGNMKAGGRIMLWGAK